MVGSRPLLITCLVSLSALAGCLGANGSMDAAQAAQIGDDHVRASYPDAMFLGIATAEGPIDPELLQQTLEDEADDDPVLQEMLDTYDLRVRNGDMADGLAGTWFVVHGTEKAIVFTQVLEAGQEARSVEIPFEPLYVDEPAAETSSPSPPGLAPLAQILPRLQPSHTQSGPEDSIEACDDSGHVEPDLLDSARVAEAAMDQAAFADVLHSDPDNDILYFYGNEGCGDAAWFVATLDLDNLMQDRPQPFEAAWVTIDPADDYRVVEMETVKVTDEDLEDEALAVGRSHASHHSSGSQPVYGDVVPTLGMADPARYEMPIEIPGEGIELTVMAFAGSDGLLAEPGDLALLDPTGTAHPSQDGLWDIDEPMGGTWSLVYSYHTTAPVEEHEIHYEIYAAWWN